MHLHIYPPTTPHVSDSWGPAALQPCTLARGLAPVRSEFIVNVCCKNEPTETHIQAIARYHITPARMATIKKQKVTSFDKDVEKLEPAYFAGGNVNGVATMEIVWHFLKKVNADWPYDPEKLYFCICAQKNRKQKLSHLCIHVHSSIIHIIPQCKRPSVDEWVKTSHTHTHIHPYTQHTHSCVLLFLNHFLISCISLFFLQMRIFYIMKVKPSKSGNSH